MNSKMSKMGGRNGAVPPLNVAHQPLKQQGGRHGALPQPNVAISRPANQPLKQQGGRYGALPPLNVAQSKPAHQAFKQQGGKIGAPLSITQSKPTYLPRQPQGGRHGALPQTNGAISRPANQPLKQQGGRYGALPPLNVAQSKPAHQAFKPQGGKIGAPLSITQSKPTHLPRQQQGGRNGALPPLNMAQIKPARQPLQQKKQDEKKETQDLSTTKLPPLADSLLLEEDTFPMTPQDVLKKYGKYMTKPEHEEILDYSEIWYLGNISKNQSRSQIKNEKTGTQTLKHIAYRYEVLIMLGEGSYGQVFKCLDHKTDELVAVKVIQSDSVIWAELTMLNLLRLKDTDDSYNIAHIKEHFTFRKQLCIVFELLGETLWDFLHEHRRLGLDQVRNIAYQLLQCLSALEKVKIIHADLKPENIMMSLQKPDGIKVIDFGLSCFEHFQECFKRGTLVYRAPEVLVRKCYTTAIDMWSLGCTLVKLYTGRHPFRGRGEVDVMSRIMEVLGQPPFEYMVLRKELFFDRDGRPIEILDDNGQPRVVGSKNLSSILNTDDELFLDFIKRCLTWNPSARFTADEALQHKWIQEGLKAKSRQDA